MNDKNYKFRNNFLSSKLVLGLILYLEYFVIFIEPYNLLTSLII